MRMKPLPLVKRNVTVITPTPLEVIERINHEKANTLWAKYFHMQREDWDELCAAIKTQAQYVSELEQDRDD